MTDVELTVVIPCRNAAATLPAQIDALLGQDVDGSWEVVVSDNGSTDGLADVVAGYASASVPVRIVDASDDVGVNHARNRGVQGARGPFILICDADDVVEPGWLRSLWSALSEGADCVGGTLRSGDGGTTSPVESAESVLGAALRFMPRALGANCGFTREVYDELGGFDETFRRGGDDTDFFWRAQLAGYSLRFVPEAVIRYSERSSARARFRRRYGWGLGNAHVYSRYRAKGMPRSSFRDAVVAWTQIARLVVRAPVSEEHRLALAALAGLRVGRLVGSWRYRVLYP